jgi:tRNA-splicing ligase RtcB
MRVSVHVFAPETVPPPTAALALLKQVAALECIAAPVIALPDFHHKPRLETPSSVATVTRDAIVLGLSSPSPGCGMALARTALTIEDLREGRLDALFARLAERLHPARTRQVLSSEKAMDVLTHGAAATVAHYELNASLLDHIEDRGNAFAAAGVLADTEAISRAVPTELRQIGQRELGLVGRGNHFLEMQAVAEVLDEHVAQAWGLHVGQIVFMLHADSGHLGAYVGRLYAHRRKNTWPGRLREWRFKIPLHAREVRSWADIRRRWPYFSPQRWVPIQADSDEGQRVLCALRAATNYAYANRVAVLAAIRDIVREVWKNDLPEPALLWDSVHNSIRREQINGQELWIHRHNAVRAVPPSQTPAGSPFADTGQPVLMPGTCRTSSYLCVADNGAACTLHSVNHGAGWTTKRLAVTYDGSITRLYTYAGGLEYLLSHLSDDGSRAVIQTLQAHAIARPIVRLRPLAVLKRARS